MERLAFGPWKERARTLLHERVGRRWVANAEWREWFLLGMTPLQASMSAETKTNRLIAEQNAIVKDKSHAPSES